MKRFATAGFFCSVALLCGNLYAADTATPPATPSVAATTPAPQPAARGPLLDLALQAARTAISSCDELQQHVGVTVVDSAGVIKVALAADGTSPRGVASSNNKAQTALAFQRATSQLGEQVKTDTALAGQIAANSNYNVRAGGILLFSHGELIGAIGVGGAKGSEKDEACALAGLAKVQDKL
jgi:uncharacterized protein GlcG (DUF336 family)